jgi:hypothetical protein
MSEYQLKYLNRDSYISSIADIKDDKTVNFANMSLKWWDKKFGWYQKGCVALSDERNEHLSYLFYKIDRYNNYLTIHNIFTPYDNRRQGYAQMLLAFIFNLAALEKVKRFRLTSISSSLDFYLSMGFIYWGVNSVGDYYCDLPLPKSGLKGVHNMIATYTTLELIDKNIDIIANKIQNYNELLTQAKKDTYDSDVIKLDSHYRNETFLQIKNH